MKAFTPSGGNLAGALAGILLSLLGWVGTYAVVKYRVDEQAVQIKELEQTTIKRIEWEELQKRLERIENKLDKTDEHILLLGSPPRSGFERDTRSLNKRGR